MRKLVFFDLETGGTEPQHPVIQIGAVAVTFPTITELASFEVKLRFAEEEARPEALELNHYDPRVWAEQAVATPMACARFSAFLKEHADVPMLSQRGKPYQVARLVGHNAGSFDGPRLRDLFRSVGAFLPGTFLALDTLQRALWHFFERPDLTPPENFRLETLCEYFGIKLEKTHDALADARATAAVYREILRASR